jgi:hypothetical protein
LQKIKDPIYPDLEVPTNLREILLHPAFNRLRFIKQLGLKAYCGRFPSANHTRYEHCLGAMHLAGKLCTYLEKNTTDRDLKGSVVQHKELIKIAALLHDIGHGPFSHTVDDVLKGRFNKEHEEFTELIIKNVMREVIESTINSSSTDEICDMILSRHKEHRYLNDIVSGELDVDRMDYLIRDAYHTGVEYRFYPDPLIETMKISKHPIVTIGEIQRHQSDVDKFLKRIKDSQTREKMSKAFQNLQTLSSDHVSIQGDTGVVLAETFLVTRKTMYQEVYYETSSRIAERMMQEAISWMLDNKKMSESYFVNVKKYVLLDDYELFASMKQAEGFASEVLNRIKKGMPYGTLLSGPPGNFDRIREILMGPKERHYRRLRQLEYELAEKLKLRKEDILIDEIKVRAFKSERVYVELKGEPPKLLEEISPVARTLAYLGEINRVNVYVNEEKVKNRREEIRRLVEKLLKGNL